MGIFINRGNCNSNNSIVINGKNITTSERSISINGKTIVTSGRNITINGNKVIVDGKEVDVDLSQTINVTIEGNIGSIDCDGSVNINGDHKGAIDVGGSVSIR